LEQERALFGIVPEEPNRAVPVPELERRRLVLGLAVRLLHLQHCVLSRRRDQLRGDPACERFAEGQAPTRRDQASVGQRYASARRLRSDGRFSRISRSRARSSSAESTVHSSGARASTIAHGPTISTPPAATASPPSSGSAAACSCSVVPLAFHFSGSATRSAPVAAARATSCSAFSRFAAFSGPLVIWTQATRSRSDTGAG